MPIVARPRMFAALVTLTVAAAPCLAEEPAPEPVGLANTVKLDLQISGVGPGWTVEVKPANPSSRFKPVTREVEQAGIGPVRLNEIALAARSLSPDRACALAIVLIDPDGTRKTFKRSIRLLPESGAEEIPELSKTFYLRTTTIASKDRPSPQPR